MKSPFKFLDSYTKDDRDIFFGRDREIEELYQKVFDSKLLLIYGVSGTGKSSLIHCGLANKFLDTDWLPIVIRRGGNIIESLAAGITSASLTELHGKLDSPAGFKKGVRSLYLDHYKPIFFIFDQFEELFIFGDKEERQAFIRIVKALTESDLQFRMIFVVREEYMGSVTEYDRVIPTFCANRVRIEKMSHRNALATIKEPCKVFNIFLEEGFAESLLDKLSPEGADIELTFLQVFLDKIFRLATQNLPPLVGEEGSTPTLTLTPTLNFTLSLLEQTGNVSDLLGDFLEEQISLLGNPDQGLAVLKSFVSIKGSRRQMNADDVAEFARTLGQPLQEDVLKDLLQTFVNLRILCDKDQNGKYELRHDALAGKIYEKISLVEKEIMEIRQFVENAWNSFEKRGVLISAADLDYIAPYESRLFLPPELNELIWRSKNELIAAKKRRRNILSAAGILLIIVLSAFTFWALKERNKAVKKEIQARANNFNFLAKEMVSENPTIAFRLVEHAYRLDSSNNDIRNNYYQTYYSNNFYKKVELFPLKNVRCISFLPDGKNLIICFVDGSIRITDRKGNIIQIFNGSGGAVDNFCFSPDSRYIVSVCYDGGSKLWDSDGNRIMDLGWEGNEMIIGVSPDGKCFLEDAGNGVVNIRGTNGKILNSYQIHQDNVFVGIYSPDGKFIATGSDDRTAKLWDLRGNILQTFTGHQECVNSILFSKDGRLILTGSDDMTARVWDLRGNVLSVFRTGEQIYSAVFYPDINNIWTISESFTIYKSDIVLNPRIDYNVQTRINSVEISPDNKYVLAGMQGNQVKLFDIPGNEILSFKNGSNEYTWATFSSDGNNILSNCLDTRDGTLAILQDKTGKKILSITSEDPVDEVHFVDIADDNRHFLLGYTKPVICVFDMNGNKITTVKNMRGVFYSAKFSPDGKSFLAGSFDKTAKLWDLNGSLLKTFNHDNWVSSVAFSPDGKHILTGSLDKSVKKWNIDGQLENIYYCEDDVYSVAFSPDGRNIAAGLAGGLVKLWHINGNLLQVIDPKSVQIWSVTFSSDGKYLATGSQTGLKLFDLKVRLEDLNARDSIEKLSVSQQLKYNLTSLEEILNSKDDETIGDAADYFMQEAKVNAVSETKNNAIYNAVNLYKKAVEINNSNKTMIGLYNALSYDFDHNPGKGTSELDKVYNKLLSSESEADLTESADFFMNSVSIFDNDTVQIKYYSKAIKFLEKAFGISPSDNTRESLFRCYDHLSLAYLLIGDYRKALDSAKRGTEIIDDISIYKNLAIAYVFNDQFAEAESIIEKTRHNTGNYQILKRGILNNMVKLEDAGITHPGFEKVKELLK